MGFQAAEPPISDCRPQTGKFQGLGIVQNKFQTVGTSLERRLRSYVIRGHMSNGLESTRTHWTNKFRSSPLEPHRTVGLEPHRTPRKNPKASPCNSWRVPKAWNFNKYFQDDSGRPEWCRPSPWNVPYFVGLLSPPSFDLEAGLIENRRKRFKRNPAAMQRLGMEV